MNDLIMLKGSWKKKEFGFSALKGETQGAKCNIFNG
jgi:hypothetical protein